MLTITLSNLLTLFSLNMDLALYIHQFFEQWSFYANALHLSVVAAVRDLLGYSTENPPENLARVHLSGEDPYQELIELVNAPFRVKDAKYAILSIEGNIGAGKSTLLEKIRQYIVANKLDKSVVCMQEPVDLWETVRDSETGETILQKFYKDPKSYAFAFQVMAYTSRLSAFQRVAKENPHCRLILCERSLEADRAIFAKMMFDDAMIDAVSYQVYMTLYESTAWQFELDSVFYLDVAPAICSERIQKRAREGESDISLEYLEKCDRYYKEFLQNIYEIDLASQHK